MKPWIYMILGVILISCGHYIDTHQDSPYMKTRYYNQDGHYIGYSIQTESGKTRYYDKNSRYKGYSK